MKEGNALRDDISPRDDRSHYANAYPEDAHNVLLHADFQPKNILRGHGDRLFVIDPFAHVGDPAIDLSMWCVTQDSPVSIKDRVEQIATAYGYDVGRIMLWASMLSVIELRPYVPKYALRMGDFLRGNGTALFDVDSSEELGNLVDACLSNTTSI